MGSLKSLEAASRKREEDRQRETASAARREAAKVRQQELTAKFKAEKQGLLNPTISGKPKAAWEAKQRERTLAERQAETESSLDVSLGPLEV